MQMTTIIVSLSIATLVLSILLIFLTVKNVMSAQAISELHKEVDDLQEKRIAEIKDSLKANEVVTHKLTEAANMYNERGKGVADKIQEAIEVMNGNQYAIMQKLEEISRR